MAEDDDDAREHEDEAGRYRRAAEETLEQLEWCVSYLRRIRRDGIAGVIEANRRHIQQQMNRTGG